MSVKAYLKGADRGIFQWECIESSTSVDLEEVIVNKNSGTIRRVSENEFIAEVDSKTNSFYEEKIFSNRLSARKWCERLISKLY